MYISYLWPGYQGGILLSWEAQPSQGYSGLETGPNCAVFTLGPITL